MRLPNKFTLDVILYWSTVLFIFSIKYCWIHTSHQSKLINLKQSFVDLLICILQKNLCFREDGKDQMVVKHLNQVKVKKKKENTHTWLKQEFHPRRKTVALKKLQKCSVLLVFVPQKSPNFFVSWLFLFKETLRLNVTWSCQKMSHHLMNPNVNFWTTEPESMFGKVKAATISTANQGGGSSILWGYFSRGEDENKAMNSSIYPLVLTQKPSVVSKRSKDEEGFYFQHNSESAFPNHQNNGFIKRKL